MKRSERLARRIHINLVVVYSLALVGLIANIF